MIQLGQVYISKNNNTRVAIIEEISDRGYLVYRVTGEEYHEKCSLNTEDFLTRYILL